MKYQNNCFFIVFESLSLKNDNYFFSAKCFSFTMVIHTDIKPFIVAGFVLVLINSSDGHPLYLQRKDRDTGKLHMDFLLPIHSHKS